MDGLLRHIPPPPADMARAIVSRVKILAGLNIAERRLPQDGRARVSVRGHELDLRVATMPTAQGEAAILRVLERNQRLLDFVKLGLDTRDRGIVEHHLSSRAWDVHRHRPDRQRQDHDAGLGAVAAERAVSARSSPSRIRSSTKSRA